MVMGETYQVLWDRVRLAHNPEVAGSNPAPATNVVAGQRPFPIGRGPLACVARDQIRDQIAGQRRLIRPTLSQAEHQIEIRGTYCNGWDTLDAVAGSKPSGRTWHLAVGSLSATFHLSARLEQTAASSRLCRLRAGTVAARRWAHPTRTHTHRKQVRAFRCGVIENTMPQQFGNPPESIRSQRSERNSHLCRPPLIARRPVVRMPKRGG
jgi:hypothetical protein